ncbi:MAG: T9SS type A sorting domain-containing protein [Ignavibacterium sp.]|nr:T9SS type A sorting domain-containing protein [Ignavibacterium sp.]MDW8376106.1 T9SS type A sorting domain-containing protein [Ignavibacteriales bacterium]
MKYITLLFSISMMFIVTSYCQFNFPNSIRYADSVIAFSSQYTSTSWSARQALGAPDTYPNYGDIPTAWASLTADGQREYLILRFPNPAPIRYVAIYETFNPGAVDTIYVKNPNTNQWVVVWSGTAAIQPPVARIFQVTFPLTSFNVNEIRIAINSPAVPSWNEIDAVAISDVPVSVEENEGTLINTFTLNQNFPNPFNPTTKITWTSPMSAWNTLKIYDILGNEIATLVDEFRDAGDYEVIFTISDKNKILSSGIYFYRLKVGNFTQTRKMILSK